MTKKRTSVNVIQILMINIKTCLIWRRKKMTFANAIKSPKQLIKNEERSSLISHILSFFHNSKCYIFHCNNAVGENRSHFL